MKQIISYAVTLVLWIISIVLWAKRNFPYLCWLLLILHLVELIVIGYRTGRKFGVGLLKCVFMGMLYGYNWWLPLQKQMKAETFSDADFAREG